MRVGEGLNTKFQETVKILMHFADIYTVMF